MFRVASFARLSAKGLAWHLDRHVHARKNNSPGASVDHPQIGDAIGAAFGERARDPWFR